MCKKPLRQLERACPSCKTDLSLLFDYVTHLREGLTHAEALTKAGELGDAVWAYLAILEIDPDNATARRQVGKVATAVRQFDRTAPGRRWLQEMQKRSLFRRWLGDWGEDLDWTAAISWLLWGTLLLATGGVLGWFACRWWG